MYSLRLAVGAMAVVLFFFFEFSLLFFESHSSALRARRKKLVLLRGNPVGGDRHGLPRGRGLCGAHSCAVQGQPAALVSLGAVSGPTRASFLLNATTWRRRFRVISALTETGSPDYFNAVLRERHVSLFSIVEGDRAARHRSLLQKKGGQLLWKTMY